MPNRGSPIWLGLSLPQLNTLVPKDIVARQVATLPTLLLTASVAPTPSTFLPKSAQTVSLRAMRIGTQSLTDKSSILVTKSPAVDVALVSSVSVLVGVGGLVGVLSYRRRRRGRINNATPSKFRRNTQRNKGILELEDLEASHGYTLRDSGAKSDVAPFDLHVTTPVSSTVSPSLDPSTPSVERWSLLSSCTPISERTGYSPWNTHLGFTPTIVASAISVATFRDEMHSGPPQSRVSPVQLMIDDSDGIDIGAVTLSSLHTHGEYDVVKFNDNTLLCRPDSMSGSLDSVSLTRCPESCPTEESLDGDADISPYRGTPPSPPVVLQSESLSQMIPEALSYSDVNHSRPLFSPPVNPNDFPHNPSPNVTDDPPTLLQLTLLESELDLLACLGLGVEQVESSDSSPLHIPAVPNLVATDSQGTVTETDESFDHNEIVVGGFSPSTGGKFMSSGSAGNYRPAETRKSGGPSPVHRVSRIPIPLPLSKDIKKRFSAVNVNPESTAETVAFSPKVLNSSTQKQSLSHSRSSSSSTSSHSVVTLKLPSFRSPDLALLTEEVLPPPSIIVSVPTDGSIRPRRSWGIMRDDSKETENATWTVQKRWDPGMGKRENEMKAIARVIYDPADEISDDDTWDEAYARTCFVEVTGIGTSVETDVTAFAASWIVSSESSELDLGETVAKFPLPPAAF